MSVKCDASPSNKSDQLFPFGLGGVNFVTVHKPWYKILPVKDFAMPKKQNFCQNKISRNFSEVFDNFLDLKNICTRGSMPNKEQIPEVFDQFLVLKNISAQVYVYQHKRLHAQQRANP